MKGENKGDQTLFNFDGSKASVKLSGLAGWVSDHAEGDCEEEGDGGDGALRY